jgi:hypothetical protein
MRKIMLMLSVSVLFLFSSFANAKDEVEFDVSKYENTYREYIADKMWLLDTELSHTRIKFDDYRMKSTHLPLARGDGDYYQRVGYIRGVKLSESKFINVKELPKNSDGFIYAVYDRMTGSLLEKIKIDEKGRLIMHMDTSNKDVLIFNHEELVDNGCRPYEDKMQCLKRMDPKKYLQLEKERFRRESKASSRNQ